ncbi:hypothetical protein ABC347_00510 [Sphingomonas sp. 1P06PA]|uniref:hypothetical protein n=1 Tax=Sphingomonas sp. 1P06PA TaxID=554121 RepID=UPI0039A4B320
MIQFARFVERTTHIFEKAVAVYSGRRGHAGAGERVYGRHSWPSRTHARFAAPAAAPQFERLLNDGLVLREEWDARRLLTMLDGDARIGPG